MECERLEAGDTLQGFPLWHGGENAFLAEWTITQSLLSDPQGPHAFWLRWYDAALQGNHLNLPLEHDIALIPDADWKKGPEHIAGLIAALERKHDAKEDESPLDLELAKLPASTKDQRATFAQAIAAHQEHLPATLSALLEFCAAEISRLQGRNHPYDSAEEEAEAQRQIRVLTTIFTTVERLKAKIPEAGPLTEANIVQGEKLSRLFVRHFKEWPRKNAEDFVDSTYRATLVGLTATLAPMIGVPVYMAVGAGIVFFGGKKIADGLKAAKDLTLP